MLEIGVLPEVAFATASCMMFFTSMAACISFLTLGNMPLLFFPLFYATGTSLSPPFLTHGEAY